MVYTHLFVHVLAYASLATVSTASEKEGFTLRRLTDWLRQCTSPGSAPVATPTAERASVLARLTADMDALLATLPTEEATVLCPDGTPYAVPLRPGATFAELWLALAAQDGTLNRTNCAAPRLYLHGLRHLQLARTKNLAAVLAEKLPEPLQRLVARFAAAPLPHDAAVAAYQLFTLARPELITAFEPAGATRVTLSGDSNETAEAPECGPETGYVSGLVRLGPLVPRGTPLRARLRLDRLGADATIGLVREEAWANLGNKRMDRVAPPRIATAGWTYNIYDGSLYANSDTLAGSLRYNTLRPAPAQELPPVRREGGVVEVELRWDAETGVGQLLYTIDSAAQDPIDDAAAAAVFQIPAEGGRVGLAVEMFCGTRVTLVAE